MLQGIINSVDAQINKTRSPLVNVLLASPIFIIVSLPLAVIVATITLIVVGTTGEVGQSELTPGIITGVLTILVFWAWAAYGTYKSNDELQNGNPL